MQSYTTEAGNSDGELVTPTQSEASLESTAEEQALEHIVLVAKDSEKPGERSWRQFILHLASEEKDLAKIGTLEIQSPPIARDACHNLRVLLENLEDRPPNVKQDLEKMYPYAVHHDLYGMKLTKDVEKFTFEDRLRPEYAHYLNDSAQRSKAILEFVLIALPNLETLIVKDSLSSLEFLPKCDMTEEMEKWNVEHAEVHQSTLAKHLPASLHTVIFAETYPEINKTMRDLLKHLPDLTEVDCSDVHDSPGSQPFTLLAQVAMLSREFGVRLFSKR